MYNIQLINHNNHNNNTISNSNTNASNSNSNSNNSSKEITIICDRMLSSIKLYDSINNTNNTNRNNKFDYCKTSLFFIKKIIHERKY